METSATSARIEECESRTAYGQLASHPELQAEAIANHYASMAMRAMHLRGMIKLKREVRGDTSKVDTLIKYEVDRFKKEHKRAFGIELEWPTTQF